ncbi:MAG: sulfotransferase [Planctomycetota bacterium]|nr:sulfotransferase [Planctomycetota bacterium]MDA1113672.1 sulfotransferase [Planctomycetota bacterium]
MADSNSPSAAQSQIAVEPFFIIGAERSGTTLLRLMLDHHPQIRCRFESDFFVDHLTEEGDDLPGARRLRCRTLEAQTEQARCAMGRRKSWPMARESRL